MEQMLLMPVELVNSAKQDAIVLPPETQDLVVALMASALIAVVRAAEELGDED